MNLGTKKRPFDIADYLKYSPTLIETGTCRGEGVQRAINAGFTEILSVELSEELYIHCLKRFLDEKRVTLFEGNSVEQLPKMLEGKGRCVIFLDAHPSGPGTANHEGWLRGDVSVHQDTIIRQELEIILAHRKDHCIIIDDVNGDDNYIESYKSIIGADYRFAIKDQKFHDVYYKDKILVCEPLKLFR